MPPSQPPKRPSVKPERRKTILPPARTPTKPDGKGKLCLVPNGDKSKKPKRDSKK